MLQALVLDTVNLGGANSGVGLLERVTGHILNIARLLPVVFTHGGESPPSVPIRNAELSPDRHLSHIGLALDEADPDAFVPGIALIVY